MCKIKLTDEWTRQAEKMLIADEGIRKTPYKDSRGIWTIWIGRNLETDPFTEAEMMTWFRNRLRQAVDDLCEIYGKDFIESLEVPRQHALTNMVFQLGKKGLAGFTEANKRVLKKDWPAAVQHFLSSLWARQTPGRAARVCELLRTGIYPARYTE